ncbi:MAG: hypothetical protein R2854_27055 [Caldilineaceae bacterium]
MLEHLRINVPSSIRERAHVGRARQDPERGARKRCAWWKTRNGTRELISDNALVEAAEQEARRIVETSRQLAYQRTQEADDYAMNVLKQLGQRLDVISQQVGNGIKMLEENALTRFQEDEDDTAHCPAASASAGCATADPRTGRSRFSPRF